MLFNLVELFLCILFESTKNKINRFGCRYPKPKHVSININIKDVSVFFLNKKYFNKYKRFFIKKCFHKYKYKYKRCFHFFLNKRYFHKYKNKRCFIFLKIIKRCFFFLNKRCFHKNKNNVSININMFPFFF
jgi:hypothetical protein